MFTYYIFISCILLVFPVFSVRHSCKVPSLFYPICLLFLLFPHSLFNPFSSFFLLSHSLFLYLSHTVIFSLCPSLFPSHNLSSFYSLPPSPSISLPLSLYVCVSVSLSLYLPHSFTLLISRRYFGSSKCEVQ